jgi:nicotinate-nucleotide pyrophosphorylase (carboxylating)
MQIKEIIKWALDEDIQSGDITTIATVNPDITGSAKIITRQNGVVAGLEIAKKIFHHFDNELEISLSCSDGDFVKMGVELILLNGKLASILTAERVSLNFLGKLSGIASLTRKFVEEVNGTGCTILDTRKTTPMLRELEKYAVRVGGGKNHRSGLYDMYLIKENHIAAAGSIESALRKVFDHQEKSQNKTQIEIEVNNLKDLKTVSKYSVDRILLDNMSVAEIKESVRICEQKIKLEVSGGINLQNIREYAETGVDFISVGQITHSASNLDLSLLVLKE